MKHLLPEGWPRPSGYSNGIQAQGSQIFVAGMIGWNEAGEFSGDFVSQLEQVLMNTVAVLNTAGAGPEHVVRMTWYVTDVANYRENLQKIGKTYRSVMGKNFPVMAVVGVKDLVEPEALLEIETTAVVDS